VSRGRVARFFLAQHTKMGGNIPNDHKISQASTKHTKLNLPNGPKIYQHLPLQDPPEFARTGNFGLRINHLATLSNVRSRVFSFLRRDLLVEIYLMICSWNTIFQSATSPSFECGLFIKGGKLKDLCCTK
jgi:hypothetical protein